MNDPLCERLEQAFDQILTDAAEANPLGEERIARTAADEVAGEAHELIWRALHGGEYDPVRCLCGRPFGHAD